MNRLVREKLGSVFLHIFFVWGASLEDSFALVGAFGEGGWFRSDSLGACRSSFRWDLRLMYLPPPPLMVFRAVVNTLSSDYCIDHIR